jgi:succinoglycan biosynthesis transport protein ExoP
MLDKISWPASNRADEAASGAAQEPMIDLVEVLRLMRRQRTLIASILIFAISGGLLYLGITPPHYTASAALLIDTRQAPPFQPQSSANSAADSAHIDSQVEILKSDRIARSVIKKLDLLSDPSFIGPPSGLGALRHALNSLIDGEKVPTESDKLTRAAAVLEAGLTVKRIGLTHVIQVDYRSQDAVQSARICNAVIDEHIVGQLETKYHAARLAGDWLQGRLSELKEQAQAAERAVAEFRANNNILVPGGPPLSEQQLATLSSQRRVNLKDMESAAQIFRSLHETLLQRSTELIQQQSFPGTEVRIVTEASPPVEKSGPKASIVLGAAIAVGLAAGLGAAFAREHLNTGFLSSNQLKRELGVNCLGTLSAMSRYHSAAWWVSKARTRTRSHVNSGEETTHPRLIVQSWPYTLVADQPHLHYVEELKFIAADIFGLQQCRKVLGICSALPQEGKSVIAASLSELMAYSGQRVILVDCDLHSLGLTRRLAPKASAGLIDAILGQATLEELIWSDPATSLEFLPAGASSSKINRVNTPLASRAMQELLKNLRSRYDRVILDFPPIIPVADVKAASHVVDSFVLVIEWRTTSQAAVMDALSTAPLVPEKLLGAVLNKADPAVLKRLRPYKDRRYTH